MANNIKDIPNIPIVKSSDRDIQLALDRIREAISIMKSELTRLQSEKQDA